LADEEWYTIDTLLGGIVPLCIAYDKGIVLKKTMHFNFSEICCRWWFWNFNM